MGTNSRGGRSSCRRTIVVLSGVLLLLLAALILSSPPSSAVVNTTSTNIPPLPLPLCKQAQPLQQQHSQVPLPLLKDPTRAETKWNWSECTRRGPSTGEPLPQPLPAIYAITPTYARPVQKAELTRLSQTLMWVENFYWIIVEDSDTKTPLVANFLKDSTLQYVHLAARTKKNKQLKPTEPHWMKARGVEQRNAGLDWIRQNLNDEQLNGVVFFMDDDNTYDLRIFDEMRKVQKVGVWPVGLVGGMMVEKPLVDETGEKITGFNSVWRPERPFPIDMAGFAIHLSLIAEHPNAVFTHKVQAGYQESEILRQLITKDDLEPLADKCTKVYVWHTRTEKPKMNEENKLRAKYSKGSNDGIEV